MPRHWRTKLKTAHSFKRIEQTWSLSGKVKVKKFLRHFSKLHEKINRALCSSMKYKDSFMCPYLILVKESKS